MPQFLVSSIFISKLEPNSSRFLTLVRAPSNIIKILRANNLIRLTTFKNAERLGPVSHNIKHYGGVLLNTFVAVENGVPVVPEQSFSAFITGMKLDKIYPPFSCRVFEWSPEDPEQVLANLKTIFPRAYLDYSQGRGEPKYVVVSGKANITISYELFHFLNADVISESIASQHRDISLKMHEKTKRRRTTWQSDETSQA